MNATMLAVFGQPVSVYHLATGVTDAITAVWNTAAMLETNSRESGTLSVVASDLSSVAAKRDEIAIGSAVYSVVSVDRTDESGMQAMALRFLRDVI